jgi:hypothetical protein
MSRGHGTFTLTAIRNAVKAVVDAGVKVRRVEVEPGKIIVLAGEPPSEARDEPPVPADWEDAK